jgi:hypothetical protein
VEWIHPGVQDSARLSSRGWERDRGTRPHFSQRTREIGHPFRIRRVSATEILTAGAAYCGRVLSEIAHGHIVAEVRDPNGPNAAPLDSGSVSKYTHRDILSDVVNFMRAYSHSLERRVPIPGLLGWSWRGLDLGRALTRQRFREVCLLLDGT